MGGPYTGQPSGQSAPLVVRLAVLAAVSELAHVPVIVWCLPSQAPGNRPG